MLIISTASASSEDEANESGTSLPLKGMKSLPDRGRGRIINEKVHSDRDCCKPGKAHEYGRGLHLGKGLLVHHRMFLRGVELRAVYPLGGKGEGLRNQQDGHR